MSSINLVVPCRMISEWRADIGIQITAPRARAQAHLVISRITESPGQIILDHPIQKAKATHLERCWACH
jgi:hypothetical protein